MAKTCNVNLVPLEKVSMAWVHIIQTLTVEALALGLGYGLVLITWLGGGGGGGTSNSTEETIIDITDYFAHACTLIPNFSVILIHSVHCQ